MLTAIVTGLLAGIGIEAVGLVGSAATVGGTSVAFRLLKIAPAVIRLARAVRGADADAHLHADADAVLSELDKGQK